MSTLDTLRYEWPDDGPWPGQNVYDPDGVLYRVAARGVTGGEPYVWLLNRSGSDVSMMPLDTIRRSYTRSRRRLA